MTSIEQGSEAEALARAVRVMSRLGYFDPACEASVRIPTGFVITPNFDTGNTSSPHTLEPAELVKVDRGPLNDLVRPDVVARHRGIYEARDDVGAILTAYPPVSMSFVAARRRLRRVTHAEAWMVDRVCDFVDLPAYIDFPGAVADFLGSEHLIAPVSGWGIIFVASDIDSAISNVFSYEYLAQMNLLAASLPSEPREATPDEIRSIQSERATPETVGSVDGRAFLRSFDRRLIGPVLADNDTVETKVALSCRILAHHRTLVGFYEHVSHRLEGRDAFAMSPAKNFAQILPEDILVVGLDEKASWVSGPHPPAPFRRFHRDIFLARADVTAIVHTHEMYGRLFVSADQELRALDRYGLGFPAMPARLGRASMVFSGPDRQDAVKALGFQTVFHTDLHGTDYVASTIEEATVAAVHRERSYRTLHTALRLGDQVPLTREQTQALVDVQVSPQAWWRFYCDQLADKVSNPEQEI